MRLVGGAAEEKRVERKKNDESRKWAFPFPPLDHLCVVCSVFFVLAVIVRVGPRTSHGPPSNCEEDPLAFV